VGWYESAQPPVAHSLEMRLLHRFMLFFKSFR
jgi:hypothetical protein